MNAVARRRSARMLRWSRHRTWRVATTTSPSTPTTRSTRRREETDAGGGRVRGVIAARARRAGDPRPHGHRRRPCGPGDRLRQREGGRHRRRRPRPSRRSRRRSPTTSPTQVFTAVDVDAVLRRRPSRPAAAVRTGASPPAPGPPSSAGSTRVLANPDVQDAARGGRRAGARPGRCDLLEGDGLVDGIDVTDGVVTLNTLPLDRPGLRAGCRSSGCSRTSRSPSSPRTVIPPSRSPPSSEATGRDLPDDFGQLVVYQSDGSPTPRRRWRTPSACSPSPSGRSWLLVVLSIVLVAATILVARRRWRATFLLGLGGAAAMVIVRSATRRVVDDAPELAARPGGKAAIESIVGGASTGLLRLAGILLIIAVAAAVVAMFRRGWRRDDLVLAAAVVLVGRCRRRRRRQHRVARRRDPRRGGRGDRRPADVRQRARPTGADHGVTSGWASPSARRIVSPPPAVVAGRRRARRRRRRGWGCRGPGRSPGRSARR